MKQVKITTTATVINTGAQTTQYMTSFEIAALTGKPHNDVLKAIRKMEPAWRKVQGGNFSLLQKIYELPNGGKKKQPYFQLTKTECLYIATKFNDEARAALSCNRLTLIAFTRTRDVEVEGKTIHIILALEWLLNSNVK